MLRRGPRTPIVNNREGVKMKVIDILNNGKVNVSCELFPPKQFTQLTGAKQIVREVAGVMPVTQSSQIERIVKLSGCGIPLELTAICDRFADDPAAMKQAGIAFATNQIIDLVASGVNNIHIYTMNKPDIARAIMNNLSDIIGKQGTNV